MMAEQISSQTSAFVDRFLNGARIYTVRVPRGMDWEPERATALIQHLLVQLERVTFLISAHSDQIAWQVVDLWHRAPTRLMIQAIHSIYPEAQVDVSSFRFGQIQRPFFRCLILYRQAGDFVAPLRYIENTAKMDPLLSLVQGMRGLHTDERVFHMLHVLGPLADLDLQAAYQRITVSQLHPLQALSAEGIGQALAVVLNGNPRAPRFRERDQHLLENRLRHGNFYNAFLMTQIDTETKPGLARVSNLVSSLAQFGSDYNLLLPNKNLRQTLSRIDTTALDYSTSGWGRIGQWFADQDDEYLQVRSVLSVEELAALWHLPDKGFTSPEILLRQGSHVAIPAALARHSEGICLGINVSGQRQIPVWMAEADRFTHLNLIGKTGVGKSTLLHGMIHQDIRDGKGVGVVDPHGQLVSDILRHSIPDRRIEDVVLLDIANQSHPPPLNPLRLPGEQDQLAAGQVVAILDKIYDYKAQRIEDSLTAALVTLMPEQTPTLRDVVQLFTDRGYRQRLLNQINDPVTDEFWEGFERMNPSMQRELTARILPRMRHFYRNPILYPILCHPAALNFAHLIAQRKIILLSLGIDERLLPGPERQLLGAVLVSQLQMAVMQDIHQIHPFFLYIDEAQHFVTSSLEQLLAEARKYGLGLTQANQYLGQLKGSLLEAVMGTVGATVAMQCGLNDARLLAPYFAPEFSAEDLMNLPFYHAAVKMRHHGQTLPAFTLQTLPPPVDSDSERAMAREAAIRQRSTDLYTPKTRQEVYAWLDQRYPNRKGKEQKPVEGIDAGTPLDWSVAEDEQP